MQASILPLALGIALAFAETAYSTENPYNRVHHRHATNAEAKAHARHLRHEALSRDPNACAKPGAFLP